MGLAYLPSCTYMFSFLERKVHLKLLFILFCIMDFLLEFHIFFKGSVSLGDVHIFFLSKKSM